MKLTFDEIKFITVGAVSVSETDGGIRFARCTEKQMTAWKALSETLGERAAATTGVRLDFVTDSPFFEFSATEGNRFEIHIDGLFRQRFFMKEFREKGEPFRFSILDPLGQPYAKGEKHRVTLFFPCHEPGLIDYVSLADGAALERYSHKIKMLFIGDSITQGWDSGYPSMGYAPRVDTFFDADSITQGIGGAFFDESTFDSLDFEPDVTVVAYGTNDWGKRSSTDELYAHATAHLSLIKEAFGGEDKNIFAISPIWRDEPKPRAMGSFTECRATVIKAIEDVGLIHIDGLSLVPPCPELFADKYLHPNALGFSFYSENLIKQMLKHL